VGFSHNAKQEMIQIIESFILKKSNLKLRWIDEQEFEIAQSTDGRQLKLRSGEVEEVLTRADHEGDTFLQVNLSFDRKILITRNLVGFKPSTITGLDMNRLPKVVTTADLVSVLEAIEDLMTSDQNTAIVEIDVLKKVYHAIVSGGEKIGFNLDQEKRWLAYNFNPFHRASA
jgi:hypothetical protein